MLEFNNVTAWYGKLPALREIGVTIGAGERVAILGHNGAGKTTFLRCAVGGIARVEGAISFDGQPVQIDAVAKNVKRGVGFVPQGQNVFPNQTVGKNLELAGLGHDQAFVQRVHALFPILDEPTTGLAPVIVKSVFASLAEIGKRLGTTLVVVEQNVQAALAFAERVIVLRSGRVIFDGPSATLAAEKDLWVWF